MANVATYVATTAPHLAHAIVPLEHPHDCVEELENCSLKDNERCNCIWQIMRVVHGIFHWLNSITCVRRKHRPATVDDVEAARATEMIDIPPGSPTSIVSTEPSSTATYIPPATHRRDTSISTFSAESLSTVELNGERMADRLAAETERELAIHS
jgi:hypothetical protein